jgi:hypothetical protein
VRTSAKLAIAAAILIALAVAVLLSVSRRGSVAQSVSSAVASSNHPADVSQVSLDDPSSLEAAADVRSEVTASLSPTTMTILGRVVDDDGHPVERFALVASRLDQRNYVVDERKLPIADHPGGEFDLLEVPAGRWEITPLADGLHVDGQPQIESATGERVEIEMNRIGVFRVSILDTHRQPIANAAILVGDRAVASQSVGPGVFEFHLDPAIYSLEVSAPGFRARASGFVDVRPRARTSDLEFVLDRGSTVRGTLRTSSGAPAPDWIVRSEWDAEASTVTDAAGAFELTDVAPGSINLYLHERSRGSDWRGDLVVRLALADGDVKSITLCLPRERPVRVVGRVASAKFASGYLRFESCDGQLFDGEAVWTQLDAGGSFETHLASLGCHHVFVVGTSPDNLPIRFDADDIEVPDQDLYALPRDL